MRINIPASRQHRALRKQGGFTLIEISLVIALLLGLIAVAFIGLESYKKGSDRAKCKMQLAAVQKGLRAAVNMGTIAPDAALSATNFGAATTLGVAPVCPGGGDYTWAIAVPPVGTSWGTCDVVTEPTHVLAAAETAGW